ncbi:MAG TPA: hypothetical protein VI316_09250 [Candidatus Dormibacteraeota bacterium]
MPDDTTATGGTSAPDPRLEAMLAGLDRLRMAGLIGEAEYTARYATITARMGEGPVPAPLPTLAAPQPGSAQRPSPPAPPREVAPPHTDTPAPPPPPPSPGRRTAPPVAAAAIAGVLAVAGFGAVQLRNRGGATGSVSSTPALGTAGGAEPATLQEFLPAAKVFVASQRGLAFTKDVPVSFLDDTAFEAKFLEGNPTQSIDRQAVKDEERVLKATHLIAPSVDLAGLVRQSGALGIEGFYDFKEKALYVRGTKPTPYVREVLVHELTHAAQDQHFGLDRQLPPSRSAESGLAFLALAEGDATRIEHAYRATESVADQALAQEANQGTPAERAAARQIPAVFLELGSFPYTAGEQFVNVLAANGGNAAVDQAFEEPPTTSAQILEPARYLTGGGYGRLAIPSAPVAPFDGGVWGALGYKVIFDHLVQTGALSPQNAAAGARAWGADFWLAWDQGSRTCWRDDVAAADPASAPALVAGISAYVASGNGAIQVGGRLTGSGPFQITACTG